MMMNKSIKEFDSLMMALVLLYERKESQPSDIISDCDKKTSKEYHLFKSDDGRTIFDFTYTDEPDEYDIEFGYTEPAIHISRYVYNQDMFLMETYSKAPNCDFRVFWTRHENIKEIKELMINLVQSKCPSHKLDELDSLFEKITKRFDVISKYQYKSKELIAA